MSEEIKTTIDKQMFGMDLNTVKALAAIIAAIVYGYMDFKGRIERLEQAPAAVKALEVKQTETDKSISSIQIQMKQIQDGFDSNTKTLKEIKDIVDVVQNRVNTLTQQQAQNNTQQNYSQQQGNYPQRR